MGSPFLWVKKGEELGNHLGKGGEREKNRKVSSALDVQPLEMEEILAENQRCVHVEGGPLPNCFMLLFTIDRSASESWL